MTPVRELLLESRWLQPLSYLHPDSGAGKCPRIKPRDASPRCRSPRNTDMAVGQKWVSILEPYGTKDKNLRSVGALILTHTQMLYMDVIIQLGWINPCQKQKINQLRLVRSGLCLPLALFCMHCCQAVQPYSQMSLAQSFRPMSMGPPARRMKASWTAGWNHMRCCAFPSQAFPNSLSGSLSRISCLVIASCRARLHGCFVCASAILGYLI